MGARGYQVKSKIIIALFAIVFLLPTGKARAAGGFVEDSPSLEESTDSNFDPFSDYSEFEENSEEESDTNFFHNGRFFSIALAVGYESFTNVLGQLYQPGISYGVNLTYFFDLKFGFQVGYMAGSHTESIVQTVAASSTSNMYSGSLSLQHFEFDGKYFFNTQNVTKGLGAFNPYLIGGMSYYTRTQSFVTANVYTQDSEIGVQGGLGLEIPFSKNKMYFGAQILYSIINFPDKGNPIIINGVPTAIYPTGDDITLNMMLGINF